MRRARSATGSDRRLPGKETLLLLCMLLSPGICPATAVAQPEMARLPPPRESRSANVEFASLAAQAAWSPDCHAQRNLAQAVADLSAGREGERAGQNACVDLYYRAAIGAWSCIECEVGAAVVTPMGQSAWEIYQQSLSQLIVAAIRFRRLDPRTHLIVQDARGPRTVPIRYYGFAWQPHDFCQLALTREHQGGDLQRHFRAPGLGISLIAVRRAACEEAFFAQTLPFAVTAVLRPSRHTHLLSDNDPDPLGGGSWEATLEFYNPHVYESIHVGSAAIRLARDLSAPLAFIAQAGNRLNLQGFLDPDEAKVRPKLMMLEPYQRGKIPVVFIHGLLSDPGTWLDAVNELRAHPDLYRQYQFWYFRYPTGGAVLESASGLREQFQVAQQTFDPWCQDEAMARMILIGHSMGGLIARLQVTHSHDILWRHAARQPLEAVRTTQAMRDRLARDFFFEPSPLVDRVVFIGTPHRGANMARRLVGRLASSLATPFGVDQSQYRQLMAQNRDVFHEHLWRAPPTSIDLLEPNSPLLQALEHMPPRRGVRFHSIIGTGGVALAGEPGDGVVSVSSSRYAGASSERFVSARHTHLHHDDATIAELKRILYGPTIHYCIPSEMSRFSLP